MGPILPLMLLPPSSSSSASSSSESNIAVADAEGGLPAIPDTSTPVEEVFPSLLAAAAARQALTGGKVSTSRAMALARTGAMAGATDRGRGRAWATADLWAYIKWA